MHDSINELSFMEPCGCPSITTPPFFVFEISGVSWKLETEKNWYSKLYS